MRGSKKQAVRRRIERACGIVAERLEERTLLSTIYVDASAATGSHDGSSWANAYQDLQQGLAAATTGTTILVAAGTYKPTTTTDRTISFVLKNGVELDGGYAGGAKPSNPGMRNLTAYPSSLSGDIGVAGSTSDNSYHVVVGSGTDATAILDGFIITAGYAAYPAQYGGGIYNSSGSPTIRNSLVRGNRADSLGGGMANLNSSSPKILNVVFNSNVASEGSGMYNLDASPAVINSTFAANVNSDAFSVGDAIYDDTSTAITLTNSIVWNGSTGIYNRGAGMVATYSDTYRARTGIGNISADPLFVRLPGPGPDGIWATADDDYGDLRLQLNSPCIDAGSNAALPLDIATDLASHARFVDVPTVGDTGDGTAPIVDMGAYEAYEAQPNAAPVLGLLADRAADEGTPLSFTVSATDADPADNLVFTLATGAPAGASIDPATGVFTWTPNETQGPGSYNITVRVSDDGSPPLSDSKSFAVTVNEVNQAPVLSTIPAKAINEGLLLTFTATATDPDIPANALTYSLDPGAPAGAMMDPVTGVFTWTPTEAQGPGTYSVKVRVTDDGTPNLSNVKTVSIAVKEVNQPPVLSSIPDATLDEKTALSFTATATDSDLPVNTLTFSLDPGSPSGASINATTGLFTWTPSEAQGPGAYTITVKVTDNGSPALSDTTSFTVTVGEVNQPPVLAAIADKVANEWATLSFVASASDPDLPANTLTYSLGPGAPAGASINDSSGLFTWAPTEAQGPGTYSITIKVADNGSPSLSDFKTFSITVNEVNQAPVLNAIADRTVNEGSLLSFTVTATDADLPANTLTYSLISAPAGASIDPATGLFTWTPTEAQGPGAYVVIVKVTDDGIPSLSDSESFTVIVNEVNQAPVLAAIADQSVGQGSLLSLTVAATDADLPDNTLIYSLVSPPAGANINSSTGTFTWTPTEAQGPNTYSITVKVADNGNPSLSDSKSFMVTVNEVNQAPVLAAIGDKTVNEGSLLSFTASATDADLPPDTLTYSLDPGAPAGASIDPATGLFTSPPARPAIYTITVRVTDNGLPPLSDSKSFKITVNDVPPTIALSGAGSVDEGSTYTLTLGPITDPGNETVTQWLVSWGDGQSDSYSSGGDLTHVYRDGPLNANISVSLFDELGWHDNCGSKSVTVNNVPPTLTISGSDKIAVGTDYTLNLSSSDPGQDSISSWTINWGDGKVDVSTPGLGAVAGIHRYYATGNYTITATATDEDGTYSAPQNVSVQVLDKPSISGYVYHDLNGNGQKDAAEVGLNQWMVFFDTSGDGKWQAGESYALSDSTGLYSFRNLTPGTYHLACTPLSSLWKASTASSIDLTVDYGDKLTGQSFGFYQPASISGNLFRDDSGNGKKEGNEPNLPGWRVYLDADKDGAYDNGETSVLTDSSGNYSLTGLLPGSYRLSYILASGWKAVSPASGYVDLTVSSAGKAAQNFAIQALPASISGYIFNDQNASTIKDATEPGLFKWQVFLDSNRDGQLSVGEPSCLTDAYGRYSFTGLFPGSYLLRAIVPFGWKNSPASSMEIPTPAGVALTNKNLGFYQLGSISGSVFNDLSGEGTKNTGEPGLASRQVFLDANKNGKLDAGEKSLLSDSAGRFTFTNLIPGNYRLAAVLPAGWRTSSPAIAYYDIALLGGQVLTAKDFGQTQKTLITGTVWNDANSNAIRDPADAGLYNYRVFIDLDKDGAWDANEPSVLTDKLGNFSFSTVAAGTYMIRVAAPKGYRVTYPKVGYYSSALKAGQALALNFGVGK